jgi:hypothetical protein
LYRFSCREIIIFVIGPFVKYDFIYATSGFLVKLPKVKSGKAPTLQAVPTNRPDLYEQTGLDEFVCPICRFVAYFVGNGNEELNYHGVIMIIK